MLMDYDIHRSTRHCAKTGRELKPGEAFYSVLTVAGPKVEREDFSVEAWQGPPDEALGWWKSHVPAPDAKKMRWAPNEVMLQLFEDLGGSEVQADFRYVLTLLLVRRRVMRLEETEKDDAGETMVLYCPRREAEYRVRAVVPSDERVAEIQEELGRLLFAKAV
jgi:hypothetical protein